MKPMNREELRNRTLKLIAEGKLDNTKGFTPLKFLKEMSNEPNAQRIKGKLPPKLQLDGELFRVDPKTRRCHLREEFMDSDH